MTDELTDADIKLIRSARLLSTKEVADRAGLAESSIRTYRTRGSMPDPDVTIGSAPGWLASTIDPWIGNLPGRGARTDIAAADRTLLREALEILVRPGATSARTEQLAQGLRDDVTLDALARRVEFGTKNLTTSDDVTGVERNLIERANTRAEWILDAPNRAENTRRLKSAVGRHYGQPEEEA